MSLPELVSLVIRVSILLVVFGLGLKATWRDATFLFQQPGLLFRSLLAIYIIMPLFAVLMAAAFELAPAVEIALVALAVSPVPPILPSKQLRLGGHESFVDGLLVTASLLAIVLVPVAMALLGLAFGVQARIAPAAIATIMLVSVLLPLGAGMTVRWLAPAVAERIAGPTSRSGSILLLAGLVVVLLSSFPAMMSLIGNGTVLAMAAFVAVGLASGHALGGPDPDDRSTLALATASRHPAVALAVASANVQAEKLVFAAILLYLIVNALAAIPYTYWRKRSLRLPAS